MGEEDIRLLQVGVISGAERVESPPVHDGSRWGHNLLPGQDGGVRGDRWSGNRFLSREGKEGGERFELGGLGLANGVKGNTIGHKLIIQGGSIIFTRPPVCTRIALFIVSEGAIYLGSYSYY